MTRSTKAIFPPELLDQLLKGCSKPEDLTGPDGLLKRLTVALVERALGADMAHHLGYDPRERSTEKQTEECIGTRSDPLHTEQEPTTVEIPSDRNGTFEPHIVAEHQRLFSGLDDKILSMYARGMSVLDIRAHFAAIYGVSIDAELISRVMDSVVGELNAWQHRPLTALYLIVYLDKLVAKICVNGVLRFKTVFVAVGVGVDGAKDVLGMWIQEIEGPRFWLSMLTDLSHRGLKDILILCAARPPELLHGLAITFTNPVFQTCIMHIVHSSVRYVPSNERKALCSDLRRLYTAETREAAEHALHELDRRWSPRYQAIAASWRTQWQEVVPFFDLPPDIRKAIYMTRPIEALHRQLRRVSKAAGQMPSNDAALKVLFIAIRSAKKVWGRPFPQWHRCRAQFAIHFEDRFALANPVQLAVSRSGVIEPLRVS